MKYLCEEHYTMSSAWLENIELTYVQVTWPKLKKADNDHHKKIGFSIRPSRGDPSPSRDANRRLVLGLLLMELLRIVLLLLQ
jgi:hypothetical protein